MREDEVMLGQDAMAEAAQERRWRRWISGRCYCTYPIPVSDPTRRPPLCERCGGFIPAPLIDATETNADAERIAELERENRILRIALLVMIAIAAVAVYLYDKAVTAAISGGTP
jgi:hypothetical protein